jgi:organic hydroperoxide reductase OsmC/OhrA
LVWKNGELLAGFEGVEPIRAVAKTVMNEHKGAWSPVHMLAASIEACFAVTFLMIAEKAHVDITSFETTSTSTLEAKDGKHTAVTAIEIRPKVGLKNEGDRSKLEQFFKKAEAYCVVGNSLNFRPKIIAA